MWPLITVRNFLYRVSFLIFKLCILLKLHFFQFLKYAVLLPLGLCTVLYLCPAYSSLWPTSTFSSGFHWEVTYSRKPSLVPLKNVTCSFWPHISLHPLCHVVIADIVVSLLLDVSSVRAGMVPVTCQVKFPFTWWFLFTFCCVWLP